MKFPFPQQHVIVYKILEAAVSAVLPGRQPPVIAWIANSSFAKIASVTKAVSPIEEKISWLKANRSDPEILTVDYDRR